MAAAKRKPDVQSALPTSVAVFDIALSLAGPDATPRPSPTHDLQASLQAQLNATVAQPQNPEPRWTPRQTIACAVLASAALWTAIAAIAQFAK